MSHYGERLLHDLIISSNVIKPALMSVSVTTGSISEHEPVTFGIKADSGRKLTIIWRRPN